MLGFQGCKKQIVTLIEKSSLNWIFGQLNIKFTEEQFGVKIGLNDKIYIQFTEHQFSSPDFSLQAIKTKRDTNAS